MMMHLSVQLVPGIDQWIPAVFCLKWRFVCFLPQFQFNAQHSHHCTVVFLRCLQVWSLNTMFHMHSLPSHVLIITFYLSAVHYPWNSYISSRILIMGKSPLWGWSLFFSIVCFHPFINCAVVYFNISPQPPGARVQTAILLIFNSRPLWGRTVSGAHFNLPRDRVRFIV